MMGKYRIDISKSGYLDKCEEDDCQHEFKNGDTIYKYNHISKLEDPYSDCDHYEEEYVFCSEKCLMKFILNQSNLSVLEVEHYDGQAEANETKNDIIKMLSNMEHDTSVKYKNLKVYAFNRQGKMNYIISHFNNETITDSITKAANKIYMKCR